MSTTKTKPALWTDPWDGKQKVMERRQPRARVDLLPPGVTAGVNGKWTYVPEVKLDQGRIRALKAAAPKELKVGARVRVLGPGEWVGVIAVVTQLNPCGVVTATPVNVDASTLPTKLRAACLNRANTYAFNKYEVIE